MYKELTSVGVYMLIYTPWNSFDVWLHHSIYIYIYIYNIYIYIYIYIYNVTGFGKTDHIVTFSISRNTVLKH